MQHNTKITVSGNVIEVLITEIPNIYGYKVKNRARNIADPKRSKEIRQQSQKRATSVLNRLITTNNYYWKNYLGENYYPAFITTTFKENLQDLKIGNREFSKFKQRFNHFLFGKSNSKLANVTVPEFQKRGAIHHHSLIFNLPYIKNLYDEIKRLWPYGSINFKSIKDIDHVAKYVCKYLGKNSNDPRFIKQKLFFHSKNLVKPTVLKNDDYNLGIITQLPNDYLIYENEFDDKYRNKVEYRKYELPYNHPLLQEIN